MSSISVGTVALLIVLIFVFFGLGLWLSGQIIRSHTPTVIEDGPIELAELQQYVVVIDRARNPGGSESQWNLYLSSTIVPITITFPSGDKVIYNNDTGEMQFIKAAENEKRATAKYFPD